MHETSLAGLSADIGWRIFNASPKGMLLVSDTARILRANEAFCKFLGCTERRIKGKALHDITHPNDRPVSSALMRQLASVGSTSVRRTERRFLHKTGGSVWGQMHVRTVRNAQGKVLFYIVQVVDITGQKGHRITIAVCDQGKGTALPGKPTGTFGLFSIRERAAAFGVDFKIDSCPGKGTSVIFTLPVL